MNRLLKQTIQQGRNDPTQQAAQTGQPTRPQASHNRRRIRSHPPAPSCRAALPRRGTLRIVTNRERSWVDF